MADSIPTESNWLRWRKLKENFDETDPFSFDSSRVLRFCLTIVWFGLDSAKIFARCCGNWITGRCQSMPSILSIPHRWIPARNHHWSNNRIIRPSGEKHTLTHARRNCCLPMPRQEYLADSFQSLPAISTIFFGIVYLWNQWYGNDILSLAFGIGGGIFDKLMIYDGVNPMSPRLDELVHDTGANILCLRGNLRLMVVCKSWDEKEGEAKRKLLPPWRRKWYHGQPYQGNEGRYLAADSR